jgi:Methyltransferase domain
MALDLTTYAASESRFDLWKRFVRDQGVRELVEVGVYRGAFAQQILDACPDITRYYLVDPWRHLEDWNKPANKDDNTFEQFFNETMARTERHADKRVVLRGRTTEVVDEIPDSSLDFAYVDGDHTLRGITIDLIRVWPKIRDGGFLAGDDFSPTIWQHKAEFEPTLVFPWAVYFAEAVGAVAYGLPHKQFLIHKVAREHTFEDLAGTYSDTTLRAALLQGRNRAAPSQPAEADAQTPATATPGLLRRLRGR